MLLGSGSSAFSQDSTNTFEYNYRKGMEYYNAGDDITNSKNSYSTVELIEKANSEYKKALPFLESAYLINPKHEKLLGALQDVCFSLYDFEKSDKYYYELKALKTKK